MIQPHTRLLAIVCFVALVGYAGMSSQADPTLVTESDMIPSRDPGIQLYVRNKRPDGMTQCSGEKTLLYVHGTSQAASSTFDLPVDGLSWMDYIAQHGYDVCLVDLRGYGGSTRPPEMEQPAAENPPIVRTAVAVKDVAATVDHILARRGVTTLHLMGWSWGTAIMGRYAAQNSDKVHRLVLYAPPWTSAAPATGTQAPLGAYQTWTMDQARSRLQNGAPEEKTKDLMPAAWFAAWSAATLALDPVGAQQTPPVVRTPNGTVQDTREYWFAGNPLWEPSAIKAPTFLVLAEWDGATPVPGAQAVFGKLTNTPSKRLVQIGEGTHLVFLEKNRLHLFREGQLFLDEPRSANEGVVANSVVVCLFFGMNRHDRTNTQWERLHPLLPPQKPHTGRPSTDHRRLLNGIRWIIRTGAPWRDLPERYGPWGAVASRC
jgi:pimeloyl-ACP methyl ester carboxylesterase